MHVHVSTVYMHISTQDRHIPTHTHAHLSAKMYANTHMLAAQTHHMHMVCADTSHHTSITDTSPHTSKHAQAQGGSTHTQLGNAGPHSWLSFSHGGQGHARKSLERGTGSRGHGGQAGAAAGGEDPPGLEASSHSPCALQISLTPAGEASRGGGAGGCPLAPAPPLQACLTAPPAALWSKGLRAWPPGWCQAHSSWDERARPPQGLGRLQARAVKHRAQNHPAKLNRGAAPTKLPLFV